MTYTYCAKCRIPDKATPDNAAYISFAIHTTYSEIFYESICIFSESIIYLKPVYPNIYSRAFVHLICIAH